VRRRFSAGRRFKLGRGLGQGENHSSICDDHLSNAYTSTRAERFQGLSRRKAAA
jgi:hypothetical protein